MRPFDSRLLRHARAARGLLVLTVCLGVAATVLIIVQAGLLARLLAGAAHGVGGSALGDAVIALLVVVAGRAAVAYASEAAALAAAATVKSQLRQRLTAHALRLGPAWPGRQQPGEITALATKGLDSLDTYFARYLPQVVLACLVPLAVLARIAAADWISAVIVGVTLPLVPVFAVLVGLHTRARTERQWRLLGRLGGHFLDVVEGLPTLKIFGQADRQQEIVGRVTDEHRRATMATLREAFLSALVLDLAATLATALVAVEIGLRLLGGHIGYESAMLILLLTPEVYLPVRAVGTFYHASMEGAAAGGRAIEILEGSAHRQAGAGSRLAADLSRQEIVLTGVSLGYPGRDTPALNQVTLRISSGDKIMIDGPSGAGKSSLLGVLLRFADPTAGRIQAGGIPLDEIDIKTWRAQIAWVPQHPYLFTGSISDNIALGRPGASADEVAAAASLAEASAFIEELPAGYDTMLGERGLQLSAGQRQRLALARAFLRDAPLLLLDEPTAHIDGDTAARIRAAAAEYLAGRTVIVVSHDQSWWPATGRPVTIEDGKLTSGGPEAGTAPAVPAAPGMPAGPAVPSTVTP